MWMVTAASTRKQNVSCTQAASAHSDQCQHLRAIVVQNVTFQCLEKWSGRADLNCMRHFVTDPSHAFFLAPALTLRRYCLLGRFVGRQRHFTVYQSFIFCEKEWSALADDFRTFLAFGAEETQLKRTPRLSGPPAHSVLIELLECYEHLNDSHTPFEWFHRLADDSAKHPATVGSLHRVSWSRRCHE